MCWKGRIEEIGKKRKRVGCSRGSREESGGGGEKRAGCTLKGGNWK